MYLYSLCRVVPPPPPRNLLLIIGVGGGGRDCPHSSAAVLLYIIHGQFTILQIDFLVNNAGMAQLGSSVQSSLDVDQTIMNVNVLGTISLTKAVLPHMIHNKTGQIVVLSSASGKSGEFTKKFILTYLLVVYVTVRLK